jgi:TnpA family transposase
MTTVDCHANINLTKSEAQRDRMVQLFASVHSGHASAINALARYGSAARGDPLYASMKRLLLVFRSRSGLLKPPVGAVGPDNLSR